MYDFVPVVFDLVDYAPPMTAISIVFPLSVFVSLRLSVWLSST